MKGCLLAGGRGGCGGRQLAERWSQAGRLEGGDYTTGVAPQTLGPPEVDPVGVGTEQGHLLGLGGGGEGGVGGHMDLEVEGGGGHQLPQGGVEEGGMGGEEEVVLPGEHVQEEHLAQAGGVGEGPLGYGDHVLGGLEHQPPVLVLHHPREVGDVIGGGLEDQVLEGAGGEEAGDHLLEAAAGEEGAWPVGDGGVGSPCKSKDVWGGVDAVLYMLASDYVLEAKEDEL